MPHPPRSRMSYIVLPKLHTYKTPVSSCRLKDSFLNFILNTFHIKKKISKTKSKAITNIEEKTFEHEM